MATEFGLNKRDASNGTAWGSGNGVGVFNMFSGHGLPDGSGESQGSGVGSGTRHGEGTAVETFWNAPVEKILEVIDARVS